jgi:D-3-phosphoglycerate dehydrogenase
MFEVLIVDDTEEICPIEIAMLKEAGMSVVFEPDGTIENIIVAGANATALITVESPIPRAIFEALPNLRMVSYPGIGVDIVDQDAAREHGIWVTNVPTANITEVATHTLAMALSLVRALPLYDRDMRAGIFDYTAHGPLRRPNTMTFGIAGLGNIGRIVASYATPFFGKVVGYDPYVPADAWPDGLERADDITGLLRQSDVFTLHMPLTDDNGNLIDAAALATMKAGSYFINVSRGGLVDIDAVVAALDSGHLAGAGLDVFPSEPMTPGHAILCHRRAILSPHAAFFSTAADEELRRGSIDNITAWRDTGRPNFVVVEGRDT